MISTYKVVLSLSVFFVFVANLSFVDFSTLFKTVQVRLSSEFRGKRLSTFISDLVLILGSIRRVLQKFLPSLVTRVR